MTESRLSAYQAAADAIGWFEKLDPDGRRHTKVDSENSWKIAVVEGAVGRRVSWRVGGLGNFKFPDVWEGIPSIILIADIAGLVHVVNEQVSHVEADETYHLLRQSTNKNDLHSVGYFSVWPSNWLRN